MTRESSFKQERLEIEIAPCTDGHSPPTRARRSVSIAHHSTRSPPPLAVSTGVIAANALRLEVPPALLARADEAIE